MSEPIVLGQDKIVEWIRSTCAAARGLLVPISGGTDSALAFWLCSKAFPEKTVGVFAGTPEQLRGRHWFESVGRVRYLSIASTTEDNIEALRWARFVSISLTEGLWLVGTRNRTESELGTYSMASTVARVLPIVGLWKTEVMALCQQIGVPEEMLKSSRRADPECGRPAEMSQIPLDITDCFLQIKLGLVSHARLRGVKQEVLDYLEDVYRANRFKVNLPYRGPMPSGK